MTAASNRRRYAPRWTSATGAGPAILGGMARQVMTGRFVGRADELARLRGGCVPLGEEGVPFAPVTEALRGLARALDPDELEAVAGRARAELARLVPDLAWGDGRL